MELMGFSRRPTPKDSAPSTAGLPAPTVLGRRWRVLKVIVLALTGEPVVTSAHLSRGSHVRQHLPHLHMARSVHLVTRLSLSDEDRPRHALIETAHQAGSSWLHPSSGSNPCTRHMPSPSGATASGGWVLMMWQMLPQTSSSLCGAASTRFPETAKPACGSTRCAQCCSEPKTCGGAVGSLSETSRDAMAADPGPESVVIRKIEYEELDAALSNLPDRYREVLILRGMGRARSRIDRTTGGREQNAIDQRISRAYKKLARRMNHRTPRSTHTWFPTQ